MNNAYYCYALGMRLPYEMGIAPTPTPLILPWTSMMKEVYTTFRLLLHILPERERLGLAH